MNAGVTAGVLQAKIFGSECREMLTLRKKTKNRLESKNRLEISDHRHHL